jgi:hypothetical protein
MEDYFYIGEIKCPNIDKECIEKKEDINVENDILRNNIRKEIDKTYNAKNNFGNKKEYLYKLYNHIIDLSICNGMSINNLFLITIKGFLIDKTYKYDERHKEDYYVYFDTIIERGGIFPVDILFEYAYDKNTPFLEEINNYLINGLFIDYVANKKIETNFLKYADWKNIKEHSSTWYIKQYKNNEIDKKSLNENNFEKRMSVLKFYSKYLQKKYPYK